MYTLALLDPIWGLVTSFFIFHIMRIQRFGRFRIYRCIELTSKKVDIVSNCEDDDNILEAATPKDVRGYVWIIENIYSEIALKREYMGN